MKTESPFLSLLFLAACAVGAIVPATRAAGQAEAGDEAEEPVFAFDLRFLSEGNAIREVSSPFVEDPPSWTIPSGSPSSPVRYVGPLPVRLYVGQGTGAREPLANLDLDPEESDYLLFVSRSSSGYAVLPISGFDQLGENAVLFFNFSKSEVLGKLEETTFRIAPRSRSLQNPGELENIAVTLQMAIPQEDGFRRFFARTMPFYPNQRHVILITDHPRKNRLRVSRFSDFIRPEPPTENESDASPEGAGSAD